MVARRPIRHFSPVKHLGKHARYVIIFCGAGGGWGGQISNGNRTELSPIRSVIKRVINKIAWMTVQLESDLFNNEYDIQTELNDTEFCYQLIITLSKFVIYTALFLNQIRRNSNFFWLAVKKSHLSGCVMVRTVQLLRHEAFPSIKLSY